jgi:hypothetical protein
MKLFACSVCQNILFFENVRCNRCGHALAYLPDCAVLSALSPSADDAATFLPLAPEARGRRYRLCDNYTSHAVCNWAIPEGSADSLCRACRFNDVIPNLSDPEAKTAWARLAGRKRRDEGVHRT